MWKYGSKTGVEPRFVHNVYCAMDILAPIVLWAVWFVFNVPGMILLWIAQGRDDCFMEEVSIPFMGESIGNLKGWLVSIISLCVWSVVGFFAYVVTLAVRHLATLI